MTGRSARARLASAALTVGLVVVAGVVVAAAPSASEVADVIRIDGRVGDTLTGRVQIIRVDEVRAAETLDYRSATTGVDTRTSGLWLVVDLTGIDRLETSTFRWVMLEVGDRTFTVFTDQPPPELSTFGSEPGIPYQGALVFELPRDVLEAPGATDARIVFRVTPYTSAEGVAVVRTDLTRLELEARADISAPTMLSFDEAGLG